MYNICKIPKWLLQYFCYKDEDNKEKIREYKKSLRKKVCQVCNNNQPVYHWITDNEPTHCRICKENGMKIFIVKNNMRR